MGTNIPVFRSSLVDHTDIAKLYDRIEALETALRKYWNAKTWDEIGSADAVAEKLLTSAQREGK